MRGSPILRFLFLVLALAAAAVGLAQVTSSKSVASHSEVVEPAEKTTNPAIPFHLVLSHPAATVEIDTGSLTRPDPASSPLTGSLQLDPENPHLALIVRWKNPPAAGEHRFAKLTLEAPGQETFTHVFDTEGDIDGFLELPLPATE